MMEASHLLTVAVGVQEVVVVVVVVVVGGVSIEPVPPDAQYA